MTRKEAIEVLRKLPIGLMDLSYEQKGDLTEALNIAITALRRPAPPIGRCKDCVHSSPRMVMGNKTYGKVCKIDPYLVHEVNPDGYCDGFKPKEAPND